MEHRGILLFLSSFLIVFLLGLQSKNVNGNHYLLAALTSAGIGICNFYVIRSVPAQQLTWQAFLGYVSGGPVGIVLSMWIHDKFVKKRE